MRWWPPVCSLLRGPAELVSAMPGDTLPAFLWHLACRILLAMVRRCALAHALWILITLNRVKETAVVGELLDQHLLSARASLQSTEDGGLQAYVNANRRILSILLKKHGTPVGSVIMSIVGTASVQCRSCALISSDQISVSPPSTASHRAPGPPSAGKLSAILPDRPGRHTTGCPRRQGNR